MSQFQKHPPIFTGIHQFRNIHRKAPALESLFNRVAGLKTCNCIKGDSNKSVFSGNGHSLLFVVTRCHSLSLNVPLVCHFINDPSFPFILRQFTSFFCGFINRPCYNHFHSFPCFMKIFFVILEKFLVVSCFAISC